MRRTTFFMVFVFLIFLTTCTSTTETETETETAEDVIIQLDSGWRFKTGDSLEWAKPEFDDTDWKSMRTGATWEHQGVANYDGYAWYRIKIVIPKAMKDNAFMKDSVQFVLGKIDDTEQTFLNGELIGQNARLVRSGTKPDDDFTGDKEAYSYLRRYVLPVDDKRIKWDEENVIAIRVHDHGGGGGLYSTLQSISMIDIKDFIELNPHVSGFHLKANNTFEKTIAIKNISSDTDYSGTFLVEIKDTELDTTIYRKKEDVVLNAGGKKELAFTFEADQTKYHQVYYTFTEKASGKIFKTYQEVPYILTPKPGDAPRVNGASVYGVRPGKPFLYRIPVTGVRPISFQIENLPAGLEVDTTTGIITGRIAKEGEYLVRIHVKNNKGEDTREFKIMAGDKLALTPPLGWNSWNCWGLSVDAEKVKAAADNFVSTGLADHGWAYINIDDGWEAEKRTDEGVLMPNDKFPDMKALADYIHEKGLKLGIYSSPGELTCGGYLGSYNHELQDAQTWAEWGIDYLKYDWCSYREIAKDNSLEELRKPYIVMREALNEVDRDIVYSLCQYGMGEVWKWGADVGGNLWRTTGDIVDTWQSMAGIGFNQHDLAPYAGPGHWNDPDMLVAGWVGWGPELHPTRLTASELYTHVSLWSLLASPLLLGCDLTKMDDFTLNLLTNDEVLAVNQDPLGKQAIRIVKNNGVQIWMKELKDGAKAVGVFNTTEKEKKIVLQWSDIGISGAYVVRDLWRQKDLGEFTDSFETKVYPHGVTLVKVYKQE